MESPQLCFDLAKAAAVHKTCRHVVCYTCVYACGHLNLASIGSALQTLIHLIDLGNVNGCTITLSVALLGSARNIFVCIFIYIYMYLILNIHFLWHSLEEMRTYVAPVWKALHLRLALCNRGEKQLRNGLLSFETGLQLPLPLPMGCSEESNKKKQ